MPVGRLFSGRVRADRCGRRASSFAASRGPLGQSPIRIGSGPLRVSMEGFSAERSPSGWDGRFDHRLDIARIDGRFVATGVTGS